MALKDNALIDLATAKLWLDIDAGDTTADFKLETFINSASDKIETYLNRKLAIKTHTERIDGNRNTRVILRHYPVSAVASVSANSDWDFSEAIDANEYFVQDGGVLTFKTGMLARGNLNLQVVYTAGFVLPQSVLVGEDLPEAIKMACITYVKYLWKLDSDERYGVESRNKQGQTVKYIAGLPLEITDMLEDYRRIELTGAAGSADTF